MTRRFDFLLSLFVLGGSACARPAPPGTGAAVVSAVDAEPGAGSTAAAVLAASASPVTYERMAAFPPPGWHVPRMIAFHPGGSHVTFLQSEEGDAEMALFSLSLATGKVERLLTAADLAERAGPMSIEEELRRERQRKRIEGITEYQWAAKHPLLVLSQAGDIFVRDGDGPVRRLTETAATEIDPRPCPTGERVAFVRDRELWVIDVASGAERALTRDAPESVTRGLSDFNGQEEFGELHGFFWAPDCKALAYLEVDEQDVGEIPVLGYRDRKAQWMMQRFPRAGTANPKVKIGLIAADRPGPTRWISWPETAAPGSYYGRFVWDDSALYVQSLDRAQQRRSLYRVDPKTAKARELIVETSPAWVELHDMKPLTERGELLWISGSGPHQQLELYDAASGKRKAALTSGEDDVLAIAGVSDESGRAFVVRATALATEEHLFAVRLDGQGHPERLTPEAGVHQIELAEDGRAFADVHSALDRLPRAVVRSVDGRELGTLPTQPDADLDALGIRAPELFEAKAEDGTPLVGAILAPEKVDPGKRYPLVWMVYGGPGVQTVQNRYHANLTWQHLADRGFYVAQLDNRGTAGRGPAFAAPIKNRLGEVELADQLAGLDEVLRRVNVDPTRVGIYGHSYGGTMAALAMFRAPDRFQVGIAGSPVSSWDLYDTGYTERYMGTPSENAPGYAATSLASMVDGLEGELFIIHATMDENVHFQHTAELIDALVGAKKHFDLLVFPGERHGYRSPAARSYAMQRVVEYLALHLAPAGELADAGSLD
jgi:dipeptidyl-peptidase 4